MNDLFVASHETHWLFYASHGWLCRCFDLETVAWVGRGIAWWITALGIVMLVRAFTQRWGYSILAGGLVVLLNLKLNLAGEWFVGGVEAKCYAYGFGFMALAMMWRRQYSWTWVCAGLACGFHILVGLWLLIAAVIASVLEHWGWRNRGAAKVYRPLRTHFGRLQGLAIGVAGILFLSGLWPALAQNLKVPGDVIMQASEAQSMWRLAHHQLATEFDRWILFCPLVAAWLVLVRVNRPSSNRNLLRLNLLVLAALAISGCGLVFSLGANHLPDGPPRDLCVRLLTLYWFRLADVMVPVGFVINALWLWDRLPRSLAPNSLAVLIAMLLITLGVVGNFRDNLSDPRSGSAAQTVPLPGDPSWAKREIEADRNWVRTCQWIRKHTPVDSLFVTPVNQQTFKWYAHRAEVASRKDMPQDAPSVVAWVHRLSVLYCLQPPWIPDDRDVVSETGEMLSAGVLPFAADYLVIEQRWLDYLQEFSPLSGQLQQVFPESGRGKSTFAVFRRQSNVSPPR